MNTHSDFRQMVPLSLSRFLTRYTHLLTRLYASAGLQAPHPLMYDQLAGGDFGTGVYALLGSTRFQDPRHDSADSNAFVTSACLDLIDLTRETVRGRIVFSDMLLGLAAAVYPPDVIATHLARHSRDRGLVFTAVQHTRALRSRLAPIPGERCLTVRYIDSITITDKTSCCDEDGTLLVRLLLALGTVEFTHAMIIPDGAGERALVEALGFRKTTGKTSCWFYKAPTHDDISDRTDSHGAPSVTEAKRDISSRHTARAFA